MLLQCFYSIRSERMLVEQINYSWLFRWFVGLDMDEPVWNHAVFSKNRERLLQADIARKFLHCCRNRRARLYPTNTSPWTVL